MKLIFLIIELREGHYKFEFAQGIVVDQFYALRNRDLCDFRDTRRCTGDYKKIEDDKKQDNAMKFIINSTWCENTPSKKMQCKPKYVPSHQMNQTRLTLHVNKSSLNDGFRNCFHYHGHVNGTNEHLPTSISYNIAYLNEVNSDTCSSGQIIWSPLFTLINFDDSEELFTFDVSINSSKYTSDFDEMIINLMCILEPTEKHKYTKNDAGFKRRAKYLFVQPLTVPIVKIPTTSETALVVPVTISSVILTILLAVVFIFFQKRRGKYPKGSCVNIQKYDGTNNRPSSRDSPIEEDSISTNKNNENCSDENCNTSISSCCDDCRMVSELPSILTKSPYMLYPRCIVTIEGDLGKGNFGTVFIGNLKMGKAR